MTFSIRRTDTFERLRFGNFGDSKSVGGGVTELRIHLGPGYRVYLTQRGRQLIIILGGGTKRRQAQDIKAAQLAAGRLGEDETS